MVDFTVGDEARLSATVRDIAGVLVDPSILAVSVKPPSGAPTVNTPVRDGAGIYHFDLMLTEAGTYFYRWASTGTYPSVQEGGVFVSPLSF